MVATSWFQVQQPYCLVCKNTAAQHPQLVEIQMVKPFAHWPQMLAETLSQMELRHQPLKHLSTLLDKMKAIKQVQSHVMSCELLNSNKANAGKD